MATTLYTSRVVLEVLGVEDYGIYDVVGGTVAMLGILTNSLANAISRFSAYELGKGEKDKLSKIFSTSVNILVIFSIAILFIGESVGVWFLNAKMNIPQDRLYAANWVLQGALITFCVNLLSVPYNAVIIAHENMKAFAYISIIEVLLKLGAVYMLYIISGDNLIIYAICLVLVSVFIRICYSTYCGLHYEESRYKLLFDKSIVKELSSFAGWNFLTSGIYILNTQGINLLINIFFGVGLNAARGIATQVDAAVSKFIADFTTAINPQIVKSYAQNDLDRLHNLVCKGAKYTFFLMFIFSLPILCETEYILGLWLTNVPPYSVVFVRLALIGTLVDKIGYTLMNANVATGKIKRYAIIISSAASLVFFFTWIAFNYGLPAESTYYSFIIIYVIINVLRLYIVKDSVFIEPTLYIKRALLPILYVTLAALPVPCLIVYGLQSSFVRFCLTIIVSLICIGVSIYVIGIDLSEKQVINSFIKNKVKRFK